jgi:Tol biopolymer transport system component
MYFSADAGDGSHLWRQRFPDGAVEQITSGPTEEEGLMVSADGRSLVTSVGLRQQAVWLHDATGEHQLSVEGYASAPLLSADGHKVCYLVANRVPAGGLRKTPGELRMTDVESGRTERLLPGQMVTGFDLSPDGRIAAAVVEPDGGTHVWLISLDGRTTPRRVPMAKGDEPRFGSTGEIIFSASAGIMRIQQDGSGLRQVNSGCRNLGTTSPDGRWISGEKGAGTSPPTWLFSLSGADPVLISPEGDMRLRWASDGSRLYLSRNLTGRTYVWTVPKGSTLPPIPSGGFRTEAEIAALPGVEIIPHGDVGPSPAPNIYVFSRETVSRNIYQIPLQ